MYALLHSCSLVQLLPIIDPIENLQLFAYIWLKRYINTYYLNKLPKLYVPTIFSLLDTKRI